MESTAAISCPKCGANKFSFVEVFGPQAERETLEFTAIRLNEERQQAILSLKGSADDLTEAISRVRSAAEEKLSSLESKLIERRQLIEKIVDEELASDTDETMKYLIGDEERAQIVARRAAELNQRASDKRNEILAKSEAAVANLQETASASTEDVKTRLNEIDEEYIENLSHAALAAITCEGCGTVVGSAPLPRVASAFANRQLEAVESLINSTVSQMDRVNQQLQDLVLQSKQIQKDQANFGNALVSRMDSFIEALSKIGNNTQVSGFADVKRAADYFLNPKIDSGE